MASNVVKINVHPDEAASAAAIRKFLRRRETRHGQDPVQWELLLDENDPSNGVNVLTAHELDLPPIESELDVKVFADEDASDAKAQKFLIDKKRHQVFYAVALVGGERKRLLASRPGLKLIATPAAAGTAPPVTIGADDFIVDAERRSVPGTGRDMPSPRFLVIHFTAGASAESSIRFWNEPEANKANAHLVIDRDGTIFQVRPFSQTANHAGASKWKGVTGLNSTSMGIELANAGNKRTLARRHSNLPLVRATHKNASAGEEWEAFPEAQYLACEAISKALVARYSLEDVIGHDDIAPSRRNDPGPAFPMGRLRIACGLPAEIVA